MISKTNDRFWRLFDALPSEVQEQARSRTERFEETLTTTVFGSGGFTSHLLNQDRVRYRAVCVRDGDELMWFWIGSHADYDQHLRQL